MNELNIKSAQYVNVRGENVSINIIVGTVSMSVPLDPNNRHYAEILKQVKEGKLTIKDAD
jgi:hypothetical protein